MRSGSPIPDWTPLAIRRAQPQNCAHIPGRVESRIMIDLRNEAGQRFSEIMIDQGYVRQQHYAVANACVGCRACMQLRVPVATWLPSRSQKRAMRRNADLVCETMPAVPTAEQFTLFRRYQCGRHPFGDMRLMDFADYAAMIHDGPIPLRIMEWREPPGPAQIRGRLVAAMLVDVHETSLSLQYSFYEPLLMARGLGTHMICDVLRRCRGTRRTHVQLGTWMSGSRTLGYKERFRPHEILDRGRWRPQG